MKLYQQDSTRIWFNESIITEAVSDIFVLQNWQERNAVLGCAKGRGTTWFVQFDEVQGAIRHYMRGGFYGKLVKDCFLFRGWEKTRSFQEYQLLVYLTEMGINVPKPIAARAIKQGIFYRADLISERIPNAHDLVTLLQKQSLSSALYFKIGSEIGKMHRAGVNHTDLNIHNILIDDAHKVWIIDFDKCYRQSGDHWKKSNIERLYRSFCKEQIKRKIYWKEEEFQSIYRGIVEK